MIIEKICVATDGSDVAVRAAQMAALLAHADARRILAVSVAQPGPELPAAENQALRAALAHADTVARIARASGVACETWVRRAFDPGLEIVGAARRRSTVAT